MGKHLNAFLSLPYSYGLHPGDKLHAHLGTIFERYTGDVVYAVTLRW
jgi:hypothetical protein